MDLMKQYRDEEIYKQVERNGRKLLANMLAIALKAKEVKQQWETATARNPLAADLAEYQLTRNPQLPDLLNGIEQHIDAIHALMWQAQQVDPSIFGGSVPDPNPPKE